MDGNHLRGDTFFKRHNSKIEPHYSKSGGTKASTIDKMTHSNKGEGDYYQNVMRSDTFNTEISENCKTVNTNETELSEFQLPESIRNRLKSSKSKEDLHKKSRYINEIVSFL